MLLKPCGKVVRLGVTAACADFHDREFGGFQEVLREVEPTFGEELIRAGAELFFKREFQHASLDTHALGDVLHFQF